MIATQHTQSVSEFRKSTVATIDRVNQTGEAELLTVNGQARAVLLSPAAYDEMAREAQAAGFLRALEQHASGESMELHAFMDTVRAKLLAMKADQAAKVAG